MSSTDPYSTSGSSPEKAKVRTRLTREFGAAKVAKKLEGFAEAARRCAAEEAAMLNYDETGKPGN